MSANTSVNVAGINILNLKIYETNPPRDGFGRILNDPEKQTLPDIGLGRIQLSGIEFNNANLSHFCDFKFQFGLGISGLGVLPNPAAAIQQAISKGKNRGAAIIRKALNDLLSGFRIGINGLILVLGADKSGLIAQIIAAAKSAIATINYYTQKIAQIVEDMFVIVGLIQEVQAIIAYLNKLPDTIKALVQSCINNFTNSAQSLVTAVSNIPGAVVSSATATATAVTSSLQQSITSLQQSVQSSTVAANPALLSVVNGSTSSSDLANLVSHIASTTPTDPAGDAKSQKPETP